MAAVSLFLLVRFPVCPHAHAWRFPCATAIHKIPALTGRGYNPWRQPGDLSAWII